MSVLIGTSGWQYASWKERFYPSDLPQRRWLEHYVTQFATVEINSTFYNLPSEATVQRWADAAPADFRFVVKASRYLTHIRRLREPEEPVRLLMERMRPLGRRLACVLVQLPPSLHADAGPLQQTLLAFPDTIRVAVEFREQSWFSEPVAALLRERASALCIADRCGVQQEPPWRTAEWGYVRFHEGDGRPYPCYATRTLKAWAQRIAAMDCDPTFVFFNNDPLGCAPRDAARLAAMCRAQGLEVSRTPGARELSVG